MRDVAALHAARLPAARKMCVPECAAAWLSAGAGMCLVFVGHPFDLIKVRLQTQAAGSQMYKGALDCARATVAKEGVRTPRV
ncbi:hypothetical protein EON67_02040 [archaeon]|nr:MAG: hypothetical protein EON67_02040 [archaeon]